MQGKASPTSSAHAQIYIGVDVCKDGLDIYFHPLGKKLRVSNDRLGLTQLRRACKGLHIVRVAMEATGKYHRLAHRTMYAWGLTVAVVNPLRARLFAEALGALAKTDTIDARMLALLAERLAPDETPPPAEPLEALQELVRARQSAMADRTALLNQRGEARIAFLRAELARRIKAAETYIARLDEEIAARIAAEPILARRREILLSIPGVGPVAAAVLLVCLHEIGSCSAKQAALLAGLAPIACDSGDKTGQRHIRGGRAHVRSGIYMAAVAAARCNPSLATFYKRLRDAGKAAKVALTAVMRKLVVLANVLVKEDRTWRPISS